MFTRVLNVRQLRTRSVSAFRKRLWDLFLPGPGLSVVWGQKPCQPAPTSSVHPLLCALGELSSPSPWGQCGPASWSLPGEPRQCVWRVFGTYRSQMLAIACILEPIFNINCYKLSLGRR